MDITLGYCLKLTFKDEYQYYGLRTIFLGNEQSRRLRIWYKNSNDL
jgi:hypothetical protein